MALQLGSSGPAVRRLQQQLVDLRFPISVDGTFGQVTDEAVRGFQQVVNLTPDGVVGTRTQLALDEGHWEAIADETITSLPQHRRQLTESVETTGVTTTFTVDVKWYRVFVSNFYNTAALNVKLDEMAASWVSSMRARSQPVDFGEVPNSVRGELEATLIAQSFVGSAAVLTEFVAGTAHPGPRIVVANMDIPANRLIPGPDLFRPSSGWPTVLRNIALLNGYDAAQVDLPTVANYSKVAVGHSGLKLFLYPEQVGLPFAAPVQSILCQWAKVESVVRPSIIARALGGSDGGPGPHVP
jgi:hypothetical protein